MRDATIWAKITRVNEIGINSVVDRSFSSRCDEEDPVMRETNLQLNECVYVASNVSNAIRCTSTFAVDTHTSTGARVCVCVVIQSKTVLPIFTQLCTSRSWMPINKLSSRKMCIYIYTMTGSKWINNNINAFSLICYIINCSCIDRMHKFFFTEWSMVRMVNGILFICRKSIAHRLHIECNINMNLNQFEYLPHFMPITFIYFRFQSSFPHGVYTPHTHISRKLKCARSECIVHQPLNIVNIYKIQPTSFWSYTHQKFHG